MGCHILDPVFSSLALGSPVSVRSESAAPNGESWALNTLIRGVFPETSTPPKRPWSLTWYDGDRIPPDEIRAFTGAVKFPSQGSIFIGTKGQMLLPHIAMPVLLPAPDFAGFTMPEAERTDHYFEFADAVLGIGKTSTPLGLFRPSDRSGLAGPIGHPLPEHNAAMAR